MRPNNVHEISLSFSFFTAEGFDDRETVIDRISLEVDQSLDSVSSRIITTMSMHTSVSFEYQIKGNFLKKVLHLYIAI